MDVINEFLKNNREFHTFEDGRTFEQRTKRLECKDGFSISIQANRYTYCRPREDCAWPYESVELGFPSDSDELIEEYAEDGDYTDTIYGYVPVDLVVALVEKHGGIKEE